MHSKILASNSRLHIYHEIRKRRIFVGELRHIESQDKYELIYDDAYLKMKSAIPLSPDLDLFKKKHLSKKGELFSAFKDRIPSRENPAFADYCHSQGISPKENNPIILLCTIGKRGPSSFIFEPVVENKFSLSDVKRIRESLDITQHDLALAFDISKITLQKIESGQSTDPNTMKLLQLYFEFPDVALWQLKHTGGRLHSQVLYKLINYFKSIRSSTNSENLLAQGLQKLKPHA